MATLPVIEGHQIHHALKVAAVSLQNSKRDVALLMVAYGTGLMPSEIAKLLLSDCLQASGAPCIESVVRPEIAFNGKARLLLWARGKVRAALDKCLEHRLASRQGVTTSHAGGILAVSGVTIGFLSQCLLRIAARKAEAGTGDSRALVLATEYAMKNRPISKTASEILAEFTAAITNYAADDENGLVRDCCRELIRHGYFAEAASTMDRWVRADLSREHRVRSRMGVMILEAYFIPQGIITGEKAFEFEQNDAWKAQIEATALDEAKLPIAVQAVASRMTAFTVNGA
ncbi:hypothetical protein [Ralstonia pseudosolanacearum]|uniref:hypothetical protein n=1 Tax=Ralstonia pseudosolanacearum TaxID=1310165 RepID=UPI0018D02ABA|nr:hypothetical protein [Ralstonia pseudosolanacearum]